MIPADDVVVENAPRGAARAMSGSLAGTGWSVATVWTRHVVAIADGWREGRMVFSDPPYNVKIDGHVGNSGKTQHREFAMASGEMSAPSSPPS
jgi:hypothetical protein